MNNLMVQYGRLIQMSLSYRSTSAIVLSHFFISCLLLTASSIASARADSLIEDATHYTIKLRASVRYPLFGEGNGTFAGSGFVVDHQRGWIATNAHLAMHSPSKIQVNFRALPPIVSRKLYVDSHLDFAIVEIPTASIPSWGTQAVLGCDDDIAPGQQVVAFGHPFGLDFTATRGIISGSRFHLDAEAIQTDAAINSGNSGGALIAENTRRVIGMAHATYGNKSGSIGMAVPIKLICTIVDLMRAGTVPAPARLPARLATTKTDSELYIASVEEPWAEFLRSGDQIVAINGDRRRTNISRLLDKTRGASVIELTYARDGSETTVTLPLTGRKAVIDTEAVIVAGMLLARSPFPESERDAVHVHYVEEASGAEMAHFSKHDQIVSIDGVPVSDPSHIRDIFNGKSNQQMSFVVRLARDNQGEIPATIRMRRAGCGLT